MRDWVISYVGDDPVRFKELMEIFLRGGYRITQRAAWPLSYIGVSQPQLLKPWFRQLVKQLAEPEHHDSIARNILRIFEKVEIPENVAGAVYSIACSFIANESKPIAIRAFAITCAANICMKYPALKREFFQELENTRDRPQPPALKVRIRRALKSLNRV
jgi:hypothetical protein